MCPLGTDFVFNLWPSGPEVPTHWVGSCFHIFRISEGSKSTQRKNILTPLVSKSGVPPGPGLLCDHWSGSLTWLWSIGPQLPTADFCIKNETPGMKFFEKSFSTYLPHAFHRKTNPLFAKNMKFSFGTNFVPTGYEVNSYTSNQWESPKGASV